MRQNIACDSARSGERAELRIGLSDTQKGIILLYIQISQGAAL